MRNRREKLPTDAALQPFWDATIPTIQWANGWKPIPSPRLKKYFEGELGWEIDANPVHPLKSHSFEVIAGRGGYDDFIIRLDGTDEFAWVHLTWKPETSPEWPHFERIGGHEVLEQFLSMWKSS